MLDIGFLPDLQRILSYLPKQRTTLLFSATFSPEIKRLANSYLQNPVTIEVARSNATAATVEQRFYSVRDDQKRQALHQVLRSRGIKQAFVFTNSKLGCARLARALESDGLRTAALHGDKSQDERLKALEAFKKGEVDLLVCTDVAARGLDIKDVPAVFNMDIPFNAEDYVHRIGRTGRAGASGLAVNFVGGNNDAKLVADIEKLIHKKIEVEALEFDEDRPRARINEGRRLYERQGQERSMESRYSRPVRSAPRDPFFDQPYEASSSEAAPAWEASVQTRPGARSISANIKPKRKVAALFSAGTLVKQPEAEVPAGSNTEPQEAPLAELSLSSSTSLN